MSASSTFSPVSRRSFLQLSAVASAAAAFGISSEALLARAALVSFPAASLPKDAVFINSNENPLGPCAAARAAITDIIPQSGRYLDDLSESLIQTFDGLEGLKPENVQVFPGSGSPLHYTVLAFTSPTRSYVTADPGFEAGMRAARIVGARVVRVGLTKSYAHDVKAMLAAAPDAGVFYVCSPNNPTGTLTSHSDIEYLLEKKPKGSILLIDEAYIHFSEAPSTLDFVKAGKDVVVLRTFSKIYGMAGLRCGFAIGRADLLAKIEEHNGSRFMPVTAVAAAIASLKDPRLIAERRQINTSIRQETFDWLASKGYSFTTSQANCFMVDTRYPSKDVITAMMKEKVIIGRVWPAWPTHVRVTVGTRPEMERFREAFQSVMAAAKAGRLPSASANPDV